MKKKIQTIMPMRGAGDVVAAVAQPVARMIDRVSGTNLQNCGGCKRRQETLNRKFPMKTISLLFVSLAISFGVRADDYTYSTNLYPNITAPVYWYVGTNGTDTNAENFHIVANKVNADVYLLWTNRVSDSIDRTNKYSELTNSITTVSNQFSLYTNLPVIPFLSIPFTNTTTYGYGAGLMAFSTNGNTNWLNISIGTNQWGRVELSTNW
jgi:hypothetical protein